ncbi:MAG: phosphatase [Candidatus Cloacimonas sp. 4484_275]|nr:MAG: phosphatase [Candidatus Cloacimonas sp. 4484_275]
MSKYAILDIGTNSIKFFIAEIKNGKIHTIIDTNNISRLGEGLQKTGKISPEAMERNTQVLADFLKIAEKENVEEITAVGTMCLRTAKNASEFIKKVKNELNLEIEVVDGEEEARLSYLAILSTLGIADKNVIVFDTGGGSTEFIFGEGTELKNRISLNIGAVYPTEKFLLSDPVTDEELKTTFSYIENFFAEHDLSGNPDVLFGIGGTVTSMGAVKHKMEKYNPEIIQGSTMELEEVERQIELYKSKTIEERKNITGLQPKRADVILAGAAIVKTIMKTFGKDSFIISDRGLRHGLMYDKYIAR